MASAAIPRNILIFGGTGTIGQHITSAILSRKARLPSLASVTLFTSAGSSSNAAKQARIAAWQKQGLNVVTGDVASSKDVADALRSQGGIDTVISALGRGSIAVQTELISLAEKDESVKWFFPSEFGTDIEYDESSAAEPTHQGKLKVRRFIRENVKKMKVTYVVTGPYPEMFLGWGVRAAGGFSAERKEAAMIGDGTDRIGFCAMPDVGKFVVGALAHPEYSQDKILKVQSFVVSPKDILAEFEKQTGQEFKVEYVSKEKLAELEAADWVVGNSSATSYTLRRIWATGKTIYDKTDNEALGVKPEELVSLSDVVKQNIDGQGFY